MTHHQQTPIRLSLIVKILIVVMLLSFVTNMAYAGNDGGMDLDFGGVNEAVAAVLDGTALTQVTVEMWIRPTPGTGESGVFQWAFEPSATQPFIYFRYNYDTGQFQLYADNGYRISTTISPGTWAHIAVTYDGTDWRLYRNGILAGAYTGSAAHQLNASYVYFGNGLAGFWIGQIDEARIWNVARTQSQIQANMYTELAPSYPAALIGYYQFNEGTGTATANEVGGADGTLFNMEEGDWIASTVPLGDLTAHQNGITAMWAGQVSTAADGLATGLDTGNVSFLNDVGDDIIFAHNNAAFANLITEVPVGVDKRWARVWELDVNDAAGITGGNVNLTFDISDAGGQFDFSGSGTYFLLGRAAGSTGVFSIIPVVSTSVTGDQLTFTVSASNLGSEFTLGATADSPTALSLQTLGARSNAGSQMVLPLGMVLMALGGAALVWRRRRSA